jgi:hypothetical protein
MQNLLNKKTVLKFSIFLAVGIVLRLITQQAPTPELSKDLWFALPAFLIFVQFFIGMCSWGAFFRSKISHRFFSKSEEALFDLSVGTVFAYVLAYGLTPLGLFSSSTGVVLWVILSLGFALGSQTLDFRSWSKSMGRER